MSADLTPAQLLGRQVRAKRATRGWTLRQAHVATGVNYMTISRLERGQEVGFSAAFKLARALGILLDGGLR